MSVKNKSTCSLIRHMIKLHPSISITKADGTTFVSQDSEGPKKTKQKSSTWEHFTHASEDRVKCKHCAQELSIKNKSTCSLIRHLLKKHPSVEINKRTRYSISSSDLESFDEEEDDYDDIGGDNIDVDSDDNDRRIGVGDDNEDQSSDGDRADQQSSREDRLWTYFELETGGRARCALCRTALPTHPETLSAHLEKRHSELGADRAQESDAELEGEDNELISEIVYLEDGNDEDEKKYTTIIDHDQRSDAYKRRKRHRDDDAPSEKYRLPKLGRNSMSSTEDDRPVLLVASGKKDNEEADAFSKYLMQLMKSLPKHIQTKLQMEIVNVVMKAKMEYEAKQQEREDEEKNAASVAKDSRYSVTVARDEPLRRVVCRKSEIDTKKDSDVLDGIIGTAVSVGTEDGAMTSEVGLPATFTGIHSL